MDETRPISTGGRGGGSARGRARSERETPPPRTLHARSGSSSRSTMARSARSTRSKGGWRCRGDAMPSQHAPVRASGGGRAGGRIRAKLPPRPVLSQPMWYLSAGGRGLDSTAPRAHRGPPWDLRGTQTLEPLRCLARALRKSGLYLAARKRSTISACSPCTCRGARRRHAYWRSIEAAGLRGTPACVTWHNRYGRGTR